MNDLTDTITSSTQAISSADNHTISYDFSDFEIRVLGVLIEKRFLTPDIYPLSLNAVVNACNQLTARDPIMALSEQAVQDSLDILIERRWVAPRQQAGARVVKFEHRVFQQVPLNDNLLAIWCVLLLRGPQTVGEIKQRTERMVQWADLAAVQTALNELTELPNPLVLTLPKAPGTKESRYIHTLSANVLQQLSVEPNQEINAPNANKGRLSELEDEVARLKRDLTALTEAFLDFKRTFE